MTCPGPLARQALQEGQHAILRLAHMLCTLYTHQHTPGLTHHSSHKAHTLSTHSVADTAGGQAVKHERSMHSTLSMQRTR